MLLAIPYLAVLASVQAPLPRVRPGVPPPPLVLQGWLQGVGAKSFSDSDTHLVVFWNLGDPSSRKLAAELASIDSVDVKITTILVWQRSFSKADSAKKVESLNIPGIAVGLDSSDHKTASAWLDGSEQRTLPLAFIIRNGVIQWTGRAFDFVRPLTEIRSGQFYLDASRQEFLTRNAKERELSEGRKEMLILSRASGDEKSAAVSRLKVIAQSDDLKAECWSIIFSLEASADVVSESLAGLDPMVHQGAALFAIGTLKDPQKRPIGVMAARQVLAKGIDAVAVWYAADALLSAGDRAGAKIGLRQFISLAERSDMEGLRRDTMVGAARERLHQLGD